MTSSLIFLQTFRHEIFYYCVLILVVDSFINTITESLSEGTYIDIRGFGSFRIRERIARIGINPKSGQRINIPAKKVPYFRAGKSLKLSVDKNTNERGMDNNQ